MAGKYYRSFEHHLKPDPVYQDLEAPDMETYSKALNAGQYPLSILAMTPATADLNPLQVTGHRWASGDGIVLRHFGPEQRPAVIALLGYGLWFQSAVLDAPERDRAETPVAVQPAERTPPARPPRLVDGESTVDREDLRRIQFLFRASF